jgi:hypothetical protein
MATLEVVGNTGNMSSEKAGVGGSTPSLATIFSATYVRPQLCSVPFCSKKKIAEAPGFASTPVREADRFLRIQCQLRSEVLALRES